MPTEYRVLRQRFRGDDRNFALEYIGFSEGSALMHHDSLLADLAGKGVAVRLESRPVGDWAPVADPPSRVASEGGAA